MAEERTDGLAVPMAVRQTAEQSFESTREAVDRIFLVAKESLAAIGDQTDVAQAAGRKIEEIALQFAEQNVMRAFRFARQLVQSRDIGEVIRLHTEFMESQLLSFASQACVFADCAAGPEESRAVVTWKRKANGDRPVRAPTPCPTIFTPQDSLKHLSPSFGRCRTDRGKGRLNREQSNRGTTFW
jgi:hypothetical protein